MKILADKVKIAGPQIDGGYAVTFYVGEYEQQKVADLMKIPQNTELLLDITIRK